MEEELNINLSLTSCPASQRIPLTIKSKISAIELHELVSAATNVPQASLKLIFRGRLIPYKEEEQDVVQKYKLEDGCAVHCMGKPVESGLTVVVEAAATSRVATTATTTTLAMALNSFQLKCGNENSNEKYSTALKTLTKIMENILTNPLEDKYRRLKCSNAAFSKRLGSLEGAKQVLVKCGFDYNEQQQEYLITPAADKWDLLTHAKVVVDRQLLTMTSASIHTPSATTTNQHPASFNNTNANNSAMSMMDNILSDPNAFSSMISNPQVQQAMDNDPRFASNPLARQTIREMQQNPRMVEQMTRMMRDPDMRSQIEMMQQNPAMMEQMSRMMTDPNMRSQMDMMQQNPAMMEQMSRMMSGGPAPPQQQPQQPQLDMNAMQQAMAAVTRMQNNNNNNNTNTSNNTQTEEELTEEEMILEAIRRSLQD